MEVESAGHQRCSFCKRSKAAIRAAGGRLVGGPVPFAICDTCVGKAKELIAGSPHAERVIPAWAEHEWRQ